MLGHGRALRVRQTYDHRLRDAIAATSPQKVILPYIAPSREQPTTPVESRSFLCAKVVGDGFARNANRGTVQPGEAWVWYKSRLCDPGDEASRVIPAVKICSVFEFEATDGGLTDGCEGGGPLGCCAFHKLDP